MQPSKELIDLALHGVEVAYARVLGTDGPLHPAFTVYEEASGQQRLKEHAHSTTDRDLIDIASLPGVLRYVRVDTGTMNGGESPIPILIAYAAERGDPRSFVFVQKFIVERNPRFSELDGTVQSMLGQDNLFRHAPFAVYPDEPEDCSLLQEIFAKWAKRLFGEAFQDDDPQVSMVILYMVGGEEIAAGSCFCLHRPSGTMVKGEFEYQQNVFALKRLKQLDQTGKERPIDQELGDRIMLIYGADIPELPAKT